MVSSTGKGILFVMVTLSSQLLKFLSTLKSHIYQIETHKIFDLLDNKFGHRVIVVTP